MDRGWRLASRLNRYVTIHNEGFYCQPGVATRWSGREDIVGSGVAMEPVGPELVGDEDVPPQADEGGDQCLVDVGLAASVCFKPSLNLDRGRGGRQLSRESLEEPLRLLPLEEAKGTTHLLSGQCNFLFILLRSCLTFRPVNTHGLDDLQILSSGGCCGFVQERSVVWGPSSHAGDQPDPGWLVCPLRLVLEIAAGSLNISIGQFSKTMSPAGLELLGGIEGQHCPVRMAILSNDAMDPVLNAVENPLATGNVPLCVAQVLRFLIRVTLK